MGWTVGDHGFEMTLSRRVPGADRPAPPAVARSGWLRRQRAVTRRRWAAGRSTRAGRRSSRRSEEALGLPAEALARVAGVFADYGNMSSRRCCSSSTGCGRRTPRGRASPSGSAPGWWRRRRCSCERVGAGGRPTGRLGSVGRRSQPGRHEGRIRGTLRSVQSRRQRQRPGLHGRDIHRDHHRHRDLGGHPPDRGGQPRTTGRRGDRRGLWRAAAVPLWLPRRAADGDDFRRHHPREGNPNERRTRRRDYDDDEDDDRPRRRSAAGRTTTTMRTTTSARGRDW